MLCFGLCWAAAEPEREYLHDVQVFCLEKLESKPESGLGCLVCVDCLLCAEFAFDSGRDESVAKSKPDA